MDRWQVGMVVVALTWAAGGVSAQEDARAIPEGSLERLEAPDPDAHQDAHHEQARAVDAEVQSFKELKRTNSEAFRKELEGRKAQFRERFERLSDDEKQALRRRLRVARLRHLRRLREENPEAFRERMQHHRAMVKHRLEQLSQTNPERYQQFLDEHPRVRRYMAERRDRAEDVGDRLEDVRDRREDRRDSREDRRDWREDVRDAQHDRGRWDRIEDRYDRREDRRDLREDVRDRREDVGDRREDVLDRRENRRDFREDVRDRREDRRDRRGEGLDHGVRDYGRGEGRDGIGQGAEHRSPRSQGALRGGPKPGRPAPRAIRGAGAHGGGHRRGR